MARWPPSRYGLSAHAWEPEVFGEFLVAQGIVEDTGPAWLETILRTAYAVPAAKK